MKLQILGVVSVSFACHGAAVAQAWALAVGAGPSVRTHHAMAYDAQRQRTVLFGGTAATGVLGDTWEWDDVAWTQVMVSGPPARSYHAMVYDSQRGRAVVFGGVAANGYLGDTWEWDGQTWTQMAITGPINRFMHAMAYDSQRGRTVLFGGQSNSSPRLRDTWEWDGVAWVQIPTSPAPSGRYYHAMVFDSQRGQTVMFGGWASGGPANDTWEWNGSLWTLMATTGPAVRQEHAMVFDSQRSVTVLHGGAYAANYHDTWEWDGVVWRMVTNSGPTRFAHAMAYSRRAARTVSFSGGPTASPIADTWEFTGTGSSAVFGQGCGSPTLLLSQVAGALPRINTTAQASLANVPAAAAFVSLGWSRTAFGAAPLPMSMAGLGMPGCDLLQSAEVVFAPVTFTGATAANFDLVVPNAAGLVGLRVYLQGWAVAPGANPGNAIVSNGLDWSIGS